jgi:hypothetical protein
MQRTPAYVVISLVFFILIGIGFAYSYFFYPNDHPLDCVYTQVTGKSCPTCGFSRAFSYYTHFEFVSGKNFNANSFLPFLFFLFQFFLRGIIILYFFAARKIFSPVLIKIEVIISISLFLLAFLPLILKL